MISGSFRELKLLARNLSQRVPKSLPLKVGGAFHSPLMEPARKELAQAINDTVINTPICPIYQNVDGQPHLNVKL